MKSLPFYRPRWLAGHVIDHPVDAAHLVDDAGRSGRQELVGKRKRRNLRHFGSARVKRLWNTAIHMDDSTPSIAPSSTAFLWVLHRRRVKVPRGFLERRTP